MFSTFDPTSWPHFHRAYPTVALLAAVSVGIIGGIICLSSSSTVSRRAVVARMCLKDDFSKDTGHVDLRALDDKRWGLFFFAKNISCVVSTCLQLYQDRYDMYLQANIKYSNEYNIYIYI